MHATGLFATSFLIACFLLGTNSSFAQTSRNLPEDSRYDYALDRLKGTKIEDLRDRSTKMFERFDENQSGSITLNEIDIWVSEDEKAEMSRLELRQWQRRQSEISQKFLQYDPQEEFKIVDKNNDGTLTKEEYDLRQETIQSRGVEQGWQKMDLDGNGGVELHEFNGFLDDLEQLDANGDGFISTIEAQKSESKQILQEVSMPHLQSVTAELISTMMEALDTVVEDTGTEP